MTVKTSTKLSLIFSAFFLTTFVANAFSADSDSVNTADVMKEIEKTLLFDKSGRQEVNAYKSKNIKRKSNLVINHSDNDQSNSKSEVEIVVSEPKVRNDLREKERMAYNSVLTGQYEVGIELYKQVIKEEPENNYAKFSLAVVYQKLGQTTQAKTLYYDLLKSDYEQKDEVVSNLLAIMIEESPKDALYLLSRLAVENPESPSILAQAAIANDKAGKKDQAIALLKKAISYDPLRLDYKYNLAVIYDKSGDYDKAAAIYSDVIKNSDASDPLVPIDQIKDRLEFIRNK